MQLAEVLGKDEVKEEILKNNHYFICKRSLISSEPKDLEISWILKVDIQFEAEKDLYNIQVVDWAI